MENSGSFLSSHFITMGGYGIYVWPSFIVAGVVIITMITISIRSLRRAEKSLAQLQQSNEA